MQISRLLRRKGHEVITVDGAESVRGALAMLARHQIGALVVSSDGRRIDGILSERDIARGLHERGAGLLGDSVASVMTADVHTCAPSVGVQDLAQMMTDRRIRHVPIVDEGQIVGIVSIGDVVKARLDELEAERKQLVDYIQTA